ncbi:DUF6210 family protein [Embleya sp. NBC_00888]|uniref:DUF6210 family protein n=1 Tax=Embleya sp. NBC_00888 TaxID=2975960 RepID=UPI002F909574
MCRARGCRRTGRPGTPVHVDESRLSEASEAWIPVTTEFGDGILVWPDSDCHRQPPYPRGADGLECAALASPAVCR